MKRFGTFEGVFTPSILGILGVTLYLRLGWVIGNTGFLGALTIIVVANLIALATALSMSSIVTNIRIGVGGAYSVITKSLGREVGGAIGIPLYLSQAFSIAFYITGFTIIWTRVFPGHSVLCVSVITWACLLIISFSSAKLAFRIQYFIMAVIGFSLLSFFLGRGAEPQHINLLAGMREVSFWKAFAIFFPAVTGFLAGASMSGELKDPGKNIPAGTLSAITVGFVVYVAAAFWLARNAGPEDLVINTGIIVDISRWKWLVIGGIMGATLSSALSMFVASPRTLLALGKHGIIPFSGLFSRINERKEPGVAILFTSTIVLVVILLGTLDRIAVLITMFFLITYGMINMSVFIEQIIGITSFRPSFKIPGIVSFLGALGCIITMFLINTLFTVVAVVITIFIYIILVRKEILSRGPDVRSGLLQFIAEITAKSASRLPYYPKTWKPNLLVPVEDPKEWKNLLQFVSEVTLPRGRIIAFNVLTGENEGEKEEAIGRRREELERLIEPLKEKGIFVSSTVVQSHDFSTGAFNIMEMMSALYFPSNVLFLTLGQSDKKGIVLKDIIRKATKEKHGVIVLKLHPKMAFGDKKTVNLWIREKSPNINLAILAALQLKKNWDCALRVVQVVNSDGEIERARTYLTRLKQLMRMPQDTELKILTGEFQNALGEAPGADMNIFGMPDAVVPGFIRDTEKRVNSSVLFVKDSELESAFA